MLDDLIAERKKKLVRIKEAGINPYPPEADKNFPIGEVREKFAALAESKKLVSTAGRIFGMRDQGGVMFLDIKDDGGQIQAVLNKKTLERFDFFKGVLDIGDFVSITGRPFKTDRGEESVEVTDITLLSKSLRPIPSERFGVEDDETRLRKRYLELLSDKAVREIFIKKAAFWDSFRSFLKKEGFLEVETPVFEAIPGGAEAEPFKTHLNALDDDFYLRISLELPLKKLIIGGFDKVFEIGRIFRNEGIDREHLQDYTQLEFYWAYHDYNDLMALVEKMYKGAIKAVSGSLATAFGGKKIDWSKKWPKVEYVKIFKESAGIDPLLATQDDLLKSAKSLGLNPERNSGKGRLIDLIFKKLARPKLIQPCFLIDPPVEVEPLAKRHRKDPRQVERFQVMACGTELGKGFSELNDPLDQRERFEEQMKLREAGDKEAQMLDEDFLEALEYGMPPTAGFGVSERLFAVLMDKPIRETVFFPLMKSKK